MASRTAPDVVVPDAVADMALDLLVGVANVITHPWRVDWGGEGVRRLTWAAAMRVACDIASSPSAPRPRVYKAR